MVESLLGMNKKFEVEYEEAPCGYVTFYNYKEPLMKFDEGHGFVGALVFDGKSDKIQCHMCGEWFDELGHHLNKEHAMRADQYKARVGLNPSTALVNEKWRANLIKNGLKTRIKNLRNKKGWKHSEKTKAKIRATLKENRDELKNLRGTCPEQLIDRLIKLYDKLGRTPYNREMGFYETLIKTYGSFKNACQIAGIPHRRSADTLKKQKPTIWSEARIIKDIAIYYDTHGNLPVIRELFPSAARNRFKSYGGYRRLVREAMKVDMRFRKIPDRRFRYTKEELIGFLHTFEKANGRMPSSSDGKRALIPHPSKYIYHFGSWGKALKKAFPDYKEPKKVKKQKTWALKTPEQIELRRKYLAGKKRTLARFARKQSV